MKILVSNDDGVFSPGLHALADAVAGFATEVVVVAPEADRSGASNSLTLDRPLYVRPAARPNTHFVNGTPTDCVHVAVTGFLPWKPDLVVSGINKGQNLAEDTLYSGTVAAAMEGYLLGIPAIAFSLSAHHFGQLDTATHVVQRVIAGVLQQPPSPHYLLNVNIPSVPLGELQGYEVTRLGRRHEAQPVIRTHSPRGEPMYWVGPPGEVRDATPGTDFHAIAQRRVSITPLRVDLGHAEAISSLEQWLQRLP